MKRFWTKATTHEAGAPRHSHHWVAAKRAWFTILPDRIECGNWVIPSAAVTKAVLYTGHQFFVPVSVLELQTTDATYQFGFNPWVHVHKHLPFEVETQTVRFRYSVFSLAVRALLLGYIAFLLWRWLS
jgi:hypothetical protein